MTRESGLANLAEKSALFAELESKRICKKQDEMNAIEKRRDWHIDRLRIATLPDLWERKERWVAKELDVSRKAVRMAKEAIRRIPL